MTFEDIRREAKARLLQGLGQASVIDFVVKEAGACIGNGCTASVLLIDKDGLLRNGFSPQLPADYLRAIDGIKPDPRLGTCAAAAATGEVVITEDFCADSKWAELKHLPLSIGFQGAWSVPMKKNKRVIGTFGVYTPLPRVPSSNELQGTSLLAETVAEIISVKS